MKLSVPGPQPRLLLTPLPTMQDELHELPPLDKLPPLDGYLGTEEFSRPEDSQKNSATGSGWLIHKFIRVAVIWLLMLSAVNIKSIVLRLFR